QVAPGNPVYSIGRPLFDKAVINLPEGKTFTIVANGNSGDAKYVKGMKLNGKPLDKPFFSHADLMAGGTLELDMSATQSK
ncbi:MAG: glycoside hydrolase family 92 protein, partial [Muribaculaceae bacterium]|nr:glycoside hydrolase family 92 protein [Muribaculaceae bacterium]